MTRGQIRSFLRSKLGDKHPTNPIFSDSDLNLIILNATRILQNRVNKVDPNPYCVIQYNDLVANIDLYALPANYRSPGVADVWQLIGGKYVRLTGNNPNIVNRDVNSATRFGNTPASDAPNVYAIRGGRIRLKIPPTANLVNGLKMEYAAHVSYADDDSVPQLPLELHDCIYLKAAMLLNPDQGENNSSDLKAQYDEIYKDWADGFRLTMGTDQAQFGNVGNLDKKNW